MLSRSDRNRLKIHVLYEHGIGLRPHSSPYLRLIRPLTHPLVRAHIKATFSREYNQEPADVVIIDRLWRRDISLQLIRDLIDNIRQSNAKIIYSLDDNYFDLPYENNGWPTREAVSIVSFLLRQADAVLVSTPSLCQRLVDYNQNIYVLPHQLDERLLVVHYPSDEGHMFDRDRITVGYMGTFTHDDDFLMILPALKAVIQRHPGQIDVQVVGVVNQEKTKEALQSLPVRYVYPRPEEQEYPLFMLWFTGHVHWDIAISPLRNTPFNDSKSDIKFLDYASIGAAGIYSQSPAYASTVHHLQDGWIAENTPEAWEEALESLFQDASLRLKIAKNASHYLYQERILAKRADDWVEKIMLVC